MFWSFVIRNHNRSYAVMPLTNANIALSATRMNKCLPLIILIACAGCVTSPPTQQVVTHLPTRGFEPDIALTALAKGTLRARDGCLRIVGTAGDEGALVIWPKGSRLVTEGRRQIVVKGNNGQRLTFGSQVRLAGGGSDSFPLEGLTAPLPAHCGGPYFSAS